MRNKGSASIWLVISLLGILIVGELGLGYFYFLNKQIELKKQEEENKKPKLAVSYPNGGEQISFDESFKIKGFINVPYEVDGTIKIYLVFPNGNEVLDITWPWYSNKSSPEFSFDHRIGARYDSLGSAYRPAGSGYKIRANFLSSDGKIELDDTSDGFFSVRESPIELIDHFDGQNKEREIFRNVYFEEDGEQFQPKLGFGKNIYFAGGYARESALTFIPKGEKWTEGTVDFWFNSIDDYIQYAKYLIHFTPDSTLAEGEKSTGFVGSYIARIFLNSEKRVEVDCGGFDGVSMKSTSPIPLREWAHIVLTWSSVGGFTRLYINDELAAKSDKSCDLISYGNIYPWLNGYGGYFGWMDELKITNVAETF